ncbi:MAG TPA: hypothetical protein VM120_26295 [Bryobacteraceae bacterium]|nr:hypothetical protein [Bryobacteraceae bacterium]
MGLKDVQGIDIIVKKQNAGFAPGDINNQARKAKGVHNIRVILGKQPGGSALATIDVGPEGRVP